MRFPPFLRAVVFAFLLGMLSLPEPASAASRPTPPVVVREANWHVRDGVGPGGVSSFRYGVPRDQAVTGDWNGDGVATPGVYRAGAWYLRNSNSAGPADISFHYGGRAGDVPIAGDWDGDGVDTVGVIRDGTWHLVNRHGGGDADIRFHYGRVTGGDVPLVGDWDGDRIDTAAVVRDGTWYLVNRHRGGSADQAFTYGRTLRGDVPIAGDWNGDGIDTPGVVRGRTWLLNDQVGGGSADHSFEYGHEADFKTVAGGSADYGSVWYRLAECESDQRWWYDGRYDGGLQFHPATWRAYRFAGYPSYAHQVGPLREIAVARRVRADQGWEAWPACTRKLGLR